MEIRKKALRDPLFPCEDIITEFMVEPKIVSNINLNWKQPNIVKFIKQNSNLLQWTEIYCFLKFFPIFTRWLVRNRSQKDLNGITTYVEPKEIVKKRILKGVASFEIVWQDEQGLFEGLIPEEQLEQYKLNEQSTRKLWTTVEPSLLVEAAYPALVENFLNTKLNRQLEKTQAKKKEKEHTPFCSLENLKDLGTAMEDITQEPKNKSNKEPRKLPLKETQRIHNFLKKRRKNYPPKSPRIQCSTQNTNLTLSDLESDEGEINVSDVINGIIERSTQYRVFAYTGRALQYESIAFGEPCKRLAQRKSKDDLDLMLTSRRNDSNVSIFGVDRSKDDNFDMLVKSGRVCLNNFDERSSLSTHVKRFNVENNVLSASDCYENSFMTDEYLREDNLEHSTTNTSFFFAPGNYLHEDCDGDAFEKAMEANIL